MTVFVARNRVPFLLRKDRRLRALSSAKLYIPAEILEPPGTPLSDLIELSDDSVTVGLQEGPGSSGKVSAIVIMMDPGLEIVLRRSTEVAVDGAPGGEAVFEEVAEQP